MSEEKVNVLKVDYGGGGVRTVEVDFPSNSNKSKEVTISSEEEPEEKKVASGKIVHRKKNISRRFKDVFLGSEVKSIPDLLFEDVLVPQLKKTFSDMVRGVFDGLNNAVDLVLFGEGSDARRERRLGGAKIDYSRRSTERRRDRDDRSSRIRSRSHHNFDDISFDSRSEAIDVRDRLVELLYEYDFVTVNDFYEAANMEPVSITDSDYGWDNLSSAVVKTSRDGGYYISFPRPRRID